MKFGVEKFIEDKSIRAPLAGKRVSLLAHPASVTAQLTHSMDAIAALDDINLSSAFGPQHGLKGDKQDNMVESDNYIDPIYNIPVFSLYGEVRRPTPEMMDSFDVILIDLQDLGCRIYTFITSLLYILEESAKHKKSVWVLDRPNPAGRPIEGLTLHKGFESFVGAGPIPMRHGMTMGELGHWFIAHYNLDVDYHVVPMEGYDPDDIKDHGWPSDRLWINPSPNAANVNMARAYAGTVMLEGATLSEGRGTTRPLEIFGAPDINAINVMAEMERLAPQWLNGCIMREIWFEPTFHKYAGQLCNGVHIHAEGDAYNHGEFKPWRLQALSFKAIRNLYPEYQIWRGTDFKYEYTNDVLAIDVINGSALLREWVDDNGSVISDLENITLADENAWEQERKPYLIY